MPQRSNKNNLLHHKNSNFPILNLKRVLQCYDVPEPMIHPPGSDPKTFLNPNPDKDCGFKLAHISPMDVDPCVVVATCEIFSKTTDLTASEHAGVTLREHTAMVSIATSDSSAHSKVLVQTASHHDEFKPISPMHEPEKKNQDLVHKEASNAMRCELCGVCCNSDDVLLAHISGKKHQKNLKKSKPLFGLGHSPAPTAANRLLRDPTHEESKVVILETSKRKADGSLASDADINTKRQKMIEGEGGLGVSITCKVCNVVCNGIIGFNLHLASQEHSAMARKQTKP